MSREDRLNFVEKILSDVERLQRLIANILRAAEVDNRGEELPVVPQRIELAAYLEDYLADATTLRQEHGLTVDLEAETDCWTMVDPMMFRQVLDNLMDNAIRYRGEEAPRVELRVAASDAQVVISLVDQGIGVPASELGNLFERFFQVDDAGARGRREGTGIGLYVVRSIVRAHGGQVEALSGGEGQGAEIRIRLPRAAETPQSRPVEEGSLVESHPAG